MTKQTYILIGCPGVGKSTYTRQFADAEIFSSDKTRLALFHTLDASVQTPKHHAQVFKVLQDDLVNSDAPVNIYDATNLERRFRQPLYERLSANGHHVIAVVFTRPLETIERQNRLREDEEQVPDHVIERFYCHFEPPRMGLDCDEMEVVGEWDRFEQEIGPDYEKLVASTKDTGSAAELADFLHVSQGIVAPYVDQVTDGSVVEDYLGNVASYYYLAYLDDHGQLEDIEALDQLEQLYQQRKDEA
ncbi:MAG: ATP-binding protein [Aerococcus sp.]|nr:ATP-binding protein [Aerococcus sp.]